MALSCRHSSGETHERVRGETLLLADVYLTSYGAAPQSFAFVVYLASDLKEYQCVTQAQKREKR